jgi:hypothetical protein
MDLLKERVGLEHLRQRNLAFQNNLLFESESVMNLTALRSHANSSIQLPVAFITTD